MKTSFLRNQKRAYTLIEALVGSAVLAIGIGAAAAMSLTLVTQEESNERSLRAFNYLDNAGQLLRVGVAASDIQSILPSEPVITSLTNDSSKTIVATDDITTDTITVPAITLTVTYRPSEGSSRTRSESIELILR